MSAPELNKIHFTNPKLWSKRKKIIAVVVAAVLVLAGITGTVVTSHIQHKKDCQARSVAFTDKMAQLDQSAVKAHDALATVDESVKEGEGSRLAHTQGFTLAPEGQSATADLNDAIAKAEEAKTSEAAKVSADQASKCLSQQDVTDAEAAVKAVDDKTQSFVGARDAYRLTKATEEANFTMDAAKAKLAQAQQDAAQEIGAVDGDSQMASDGNVKGAYDALKTVEGDSHSLSTTVTATSYDEAVASIAKAKDVDQKAEDIKKAQESLKNAENAYREAQTAQAAAARSAQQSASSNGGSARSYGSTSGSQARSYSNGGGSGSTGGSSYSNGGSNSGSGSGGNQSQSRTGDESWRQYVKSGSEIKPGMHCYIVGKDQYICS